MQLYPHRAAKIIKKLQRSGSGKSGELNNQSTNF